ncbi:MAG TPA: hypothetical protein DCM14_02200 [Clostridiales bacterium UBA8153]|nr:hypothetical protein [Clostridiales bacterium UBA8153]
MFPFLQMARSFRITEFLEGIEALAVWTWGMGMFTARVHLHVLRCAVPSSAFGRERLPPALTLPMAVH